jgi:Fe2+ or Zn2+ uptake regulation protein
METTDQQARAEEALRAAGYRVTPQRLIIHGTLVELGRHVGAEELLAAASERLPNVSLPTVYASLEALEDAGLVRRVAAGRGRALYDARPVDHHHLVCRRCGRVEDLDASVPLDRALASARRHGFAADGAEVVVHGLCASCASERG